MGTFKILFINLGYARGISGRLADHIRYVYRHLYCSPAIQRASLQKLNKLITEEQPDLCCLVEIDQGSFGSARVNQLELLLNENYPFSDIENKYGPVSRLRSFTFTSGKSNALLARKEYSFEKLLFTHGIKRLVYKISLAPNLTLFFAHFSLTKRVRARQLLEARELMKNAVGEVIFLGDFNILTGLQEITPMLDDGRFVLLNKQGDPTFQFHKRKLILDLCICTPGIAQRAALRIVSQSYSDHAALLLQLDENMMESL